MNILRKILIKYQIECVFFSIIQCLIEFLISIAQGYTRGSQRDPEEELRSVFKGKVARNNGLKNDFFQFLT